VEQGEIQRRDRIIVRMPHRSSMHPMGDVVPHAVALDADSYGVSTRWLVHWDSWHEGADASRRHRWNERHDSTSLPFQLQKAASSEAASRPETALLCALVAPQSATILPKSETILKRTSASTPVVRSPAYTGKFANSGTCSRTQAPPIRSGFECCSLYRRTRPNMVSSGSCSVG